LKEERKRRNILKERIAFVIHTGRAMKESPYISIHHTRQHKQKLTEGINKLI